MRCSQTIVGTHDNARTTLKTRRMFDSLPRRHVGMVPPPIEYSICENQKTNSRCDVAVCELLDNDR
jgi:hypothetical protein